MATTIQAPSIPAPKHLWIVGILALLWNGMGAFDYVMTETRNAAYLSSFTKEQLAYFTSFPAWVIACWAVAVWGGVAASLLLLLRKRLAVPLFTASLVAMLAVTVFNFGLSDGLAVMGREAAVFSGVIFVVAVALLLYARWLARRGVLQ